MPNGQECMAIDTQRKLQLTDILGPATLIVYFVVIIFGYKKSNHDSANCFEGRVYSGTSE